MMDDHSLGQVTLSSNSVKQSNESVGINRPQMYIAITERERLRFLGSEMSIQGFRLDRELAFDLDQCLVSSFDLNCRLSR